LKIKLKILGSGSSGNSYALIADNGEILAIEAGCKFMDFKKMIDWKISNVVGCIVTHEHLDHARYIKDFMQSGIPVYTAFETQSALETITGERTIALSPNKSYQISSFTVVPFNVPHDTEIECYGYLIKHEEMGKLLFLTDLEYCKYDFSSMKVEQIMVEANYSMDLVDRDEPNYEHRLRGHMSLDTALKFISTNDNPALRNVVLIHLSDKSGDPALFKQKTEETVKYGANVYIAEKGLEVDMNLCPF
jgi:phosphoribosyl 1,2-cyclic phosphodiesterase